MAIYTDWYDFPDDGEAFKKLPKTINKDFNWVTENPTLQRRPLPSDISLMVDYLADIYSQATKKDNADITKVIKDTLFELGNAARKNDMYNSALLDDDTFARYCALFSLVCSQEQDFSFLLDLWNQLSPNLKVSEILLNQDLIRGKKKGKFNKATTIIEQLNQKQTNKSIHGRSRE